MQMTAPHTYMFTSTARVVILRQFFLIEKSPSLTLHEHHETLATQFLRTHITGLVTEEAAHYDTSPASNTHRRALAPNGHHTLTAFQIKLRCAGSTHVSKWRPRCPSTTSPGRNETSVSVSKKNLSTCCAVSRCQAGAIPWMTLCVCVCVCPTTVEKIPGKNIKFINYFVICKIYINSETEYA